MFDPNKTVFILGAGASWHYGYPTGEDLVKKVVTKAHIAADHFREIADNPQAFVHRPKYIARNSRISNASSLNRIQDDWQNAIYECNDLINRLSSVDPLVIDYFIGQNPHLSDIGKLLIAWVLLECEAFWLKYEVNKNRLDAILRSLTPGSAGISLNIEALRSSNDNRYRFLIHKPVTNCKDAESLLENKVTFITFNYDVLLSIKFSVDYPL
jgi:hypothetical protein